jgi:glycopeptide antibiotics resistance protein
VIELVFSQLTVVFRIGLIVALVVTMFRTSTVTGRVLPLAAGVVFVAVILPTTMPSGSANLGDEIIAGLITNLIILVPVLVLARLFVKLRR